MIRFNANRASFGVALATGVVIAVFVLAGHLTAQAQPQGEERPTGVLKVGIYNSEEAFWAHPALEDVAEARKAAQDQLGQAQQEEDQQKMRQIQQQYEQAYQQAIKRFEEDLSRAIPKVAKAAGVEIVAREIVYKADNVQSVNITSQLIETFKKNNGDGQGDEDGGGQAPQTQPQLR